MTVVSLTERKSREAERRRVAARSAIADLKSYARQNGGRFWIFGSVARDEVRYDSDLDVLVDFPCDEADALLFAECVCERAGIPLDIQSRTTADPSLIDRIRNDAVLLP